MVEYVSSLYWVLQGDGLITALIADDDGVQWHKFFMTCERNHRIEFVMS